MKKLQKIMKQNGFYQFRAMAERFKKGKGYAFKRVGTDHSINDLYWLDGKSVVHLSEGITKSMIRHYISIHRYIMTGRGSTPLIKKLEEHEIDLDEFLGNLATRGFTSRRIIQQLKVVKNKKVWEKWADDLSRAHYRHNHTDYDSIDKKHMTDYEIRELRRECKGA